MCVCVYKSFMRSNSRYLDPGWCSGGRAIYIYIYIFFIFFFYVYIYIYIYLYLYIYNI